VVVVHGNSAEETPAPYARYLARAVRTRFGLRGTPLKIEFRTNENPYAGRRNPLTPRQARHRKRLIRHARRRGR
jgi:GTP-binding protein